MALTIDLNCIFPEAADGTRSPLPKQRAFLRAVLDPKGPKYIGYYGGYGCLRGDSLIQTERGLVPIKDIKFGDQVLTMHPGASYCPVIGSYPKGRGRLYRIVHERGEFVASAEHLTYVQGRGYLHAFDLEVGHALYFASPAQTSLARNSPTWPLDADRLLQTAANYLDRCAEYLHQYGQLPPQVLSNVQEFLPLLNGALKCNPTFEHADALWEQVPDGSHLDQWLTLLESYRSFVLQAHHAEALAGYISSLVSEQTLGSDSTLPQSLWKNESRRTLELHGDDHAPVASLESSLILSIEHLPTEETYYDLEVLSTGHYVDASGIVHHNSGKSVVLCSSIISQAVAFGGDYLISRHFMPELRRTTMKTFLDLCPKELILEVRVADAEVHLRSSNGKSVIYFIGLDEPGKIDSMNLSGFAIDEASQTTEEAFLKLQGRLRNPKGLRKGLVVGNPKGRDHVYRYFVSKQVLKATQSKTLEQVKADYLMIVAPSTENVHLPEGYVEGMLATYSPERIERDVNGSFDSFEGMIYSEFNRQTHVIEPFDIPDSWTRVIGHDHGFTNPSASIFGAVDNDGNLYIYDEFYQREWLIEDIVKKGLLPKIGRNKIEAIFIDPSTKAKRGQTGVSDFTTYLEHLPTKIPLIGANNEVSAGIDRVKSFLRINPKTKKPRMFIFSTCVNLIEEIGEYQWQELTAGQAGKVNEKEAPRKYNDHAVDAWRYLVMSRPDPNRLDKTPAYRKGWPTPSKVLQAELASKRNPPVKDPFGDY